MSLSKKQKTIAQRMRQEATYTAAELGCPLNTLQAMRAAGYVRNLDKCGTSETYCKATETIRWEVDMDLEALKYLLLLIGVEPKEDEFKSWSLYDLIKARNYAANAYLSASDNIVRVPGIPECIQKHIKKP